MNKKLLLAAIFAYGSAGTSLVYGAPAVPQTLKTGSPNPANTASVLAAAPLAPKAPVPAYMSYQFYGDGYRDPFIPLLGSDIRSDQSLDRPPSVSSLVLKGIVQDAKGRMALLVSGTNSYILRGGRLYDGRNRMVKKISGVIKPDSVVVIGADRTVRELRAKTDL